ncbi:MAG: HAD family phosphatase [Candidatus Nanopelagicales bacterium]|nr:HAD family phosphatase [Candidatus Nanopelagicales bacterium]MDP4824904.1 HAD family phosphatase [Candidatus Nanopelagicales bacterium]MDP4887237.1 HAD family phosphatase [Candidatus Nanopelagicales bacterium]
MDPTSLDPVSFGYAGLIVDWGGVLTENLKDAVNRWAVADDIDIDAYVAIMRSWLGEDGEIEARLNPIHALERGEMQVPHFESRLAEELTLRSGRPVVEQGLLARMFSAFEHSHDMNGLVRRARAAGIRTALLSNSWGEHYPRDLWQDMFDVTVISGEVGMRKPEERIFTHTLELLDLPPTECVFVDDLPHNIRAGAELGLTGVLHTSFAQSQIELSALFGVDLS